MITLNPKLERALRWVVLLPAACCGAWLVQAVIRAWYDGWTSGDDLLAFGTRVIVEFIGWAGMGMAFVYIGTYIAPAHRMRVCYSLAGAGIFIAGGYMVAAIVAHSYWAMWADIATLVGIVGGAYSIRKEDGAAEEEDDESHIDG